MTDKRLVVLVGATGSGKTDLSIRLAKHYRAPILSTDSRQVYRGMPIGTAQPTNEQLKAIEHHFIATLDIQQDFNCGQYEVQALELLRRAMVDEGKIAIGTTVLGNSETPIALIPHDDDLVMMTLHYQSEVKDIPKTLQHPDVADEELSMAKQLVESMTAPFDPSRFRNTYQEKLMQLIQDKIAGKQIVAESQEAQPSNIINLMDALSASLKARDGKDGEPKKPAPAKKPARKRASA